MSTQDDVIRISSLLSSRLCHDLVNPVGAIGNGLDLLEDETDPQMRAETMDLVRTTVSRTASTLKLARLAYGASGGMEGELDMREAHSAAMEFYEHARAELVWGLDVPTMAKWRGRAMLNVLVACERSVPRDNSTVTVTDEDGVLSVRARGPKVKCPDGMIAAFEGDGEGLEPKDTPAYLAALLARSGGERIDVSFSLDEHLDIRFVPA